MLGDLVLSFLISVASLTVALLVASKIAWINASFPNLLLVAGGVSVVNAIPRVGLILGVPTFLWLATRQLGVTGMEAFYLFLMVLCLYLLFFVLIFF